MRSPAFSSSVSGCFLESLTRGLPYQGDAPSTRTSSCVVDLVVPQPPDSLRVIEPKPFLFILDSTFKVDLRLGSCVTGT